MAEGETIISVSMVISHILAFLMGVGVCFTIKIVITKYKNTKNVYKVKQSGNITKGNIAGRDVNK